YFRRRRSTCSVSTSCPRASCLRTSWRAEGASRKPVTTAFGSLLVSEGTSILRRSVVRGRRARCSWVGRAPPPSWFDPKEQLTVVFMTQVMGTDARLTLRRDLRTLVYSAMTESYA